MTLGVAAAAEGIMSSSDLPEVIVFAVTGNSDALFRAGHRLVSGGREVDDRQPRMGRDPPGRQPKCLRHPGRGAAHRDHRRKRDLSSLQGDIAWSRRKPPMPRMPRRVEFCDATWIVHAMSKDEQSGFTLVEVLVTLVLLGM